MELEKGLAQVSYKLPEEPNLGKWTIKAKIISNEDNIPIKPIFFEVNENVLPSFEVSIDPPQFILKDSQSEKIKVCAKYTHGANVKGQANVTVSTKYRTGSYWRAPYTSINLNKLMILGDDGCTVIELNSEEVSSLGKLY